MKKGLAYPFLATAVLAVGGAVILGMGPERPVNLPVAADASPVGLEERLNTRTINEPIQPIVPIDYDAAKAAIGERLFHDPRLSRDHTVSCATCHDLSRGGTDHRPRSIGVGGALGEVNALTVYNSALNFRQFWNGRADGLAEQLDRVITSPIEMGSTWDAVVDELRADHGYLREFAAVFGKRIGDIRCGGADRCDAHVTRATVTEALVEFERSLVTPNSRFDRYLLGDTMAITAEEKTGYELFKSYGCIACHQGRNVGGNMFQIFGVMDDYFANRGDVTEADYGRYNVTGREEDRYRFRVPSLRNVALTPPYFHDGTAETLDQAVMVMARYQLGVTMPIEDAELIVQFLGTLTGEYRGNPL